ncbi:MAG TPA: glycosyltransferase [Vicinamibacterales bacterium]|nr:glycosyltransferase [Vicinamibacterales bacterium]
MTPKVLLVDTTQHQPSSPMFAEALARATTAGRVSGSFVDEGPTFDRLASSRAERFLRRVRPWPHKSVAELHRAIVSQAEAIRPDIVLVVKGAHLTTECLTALKATGATLVNFSTDDPFNPRTSSRLWRRTLPLYDLVCSPRHANITDLRSLGVSSVEFVPFGYKPDVHFPEVAATADERTRFESDVCFIGGADTDRVKYFEELVHQLPHVRLALYGGYWNRSHRLARYWRGFAVGRDFRLAVGGAAITVNLVRRANRDDHVMRTFEVPACGGCMLTEATASHRAWFAEGQDAFMFDSPGGLARGVRFLLGRPELRRRAAAAGRCKVVEMPNRYDDRLATILRAAIERRRPAVN